VTREKHIHHIAYNIHINYSRPIGPICHLQKVNHDLCTVYE